MSDHTTGVAGRVLTAVGSAAMSRAVLSVVRRNPGLRSFPQAAMVIVVAPAAAVASAVFVVVTPVTGFVGHCELYRLVVRLTDETERVGDGAFDTDS